MSWFILIIAGLLEVAWTIGLKYSQGYTRPLPTVLTIIAMIVSMYLLGKATQTLPIGTAYAVWVGIGAAGAAIAGVVLFKEAVTFPRIFFFIMLMTSILGLKLSSGSHSP